MTDDIIARIDRVLALPGPKNRYTDEDVNVLTYIRRQITAEGIAARDEDHKIVTHLLEAAKARLAPYERNIPNEL